MDEEGLRTEGYDLILLGTGLTMAILSAAAAKAGKTVLHMDKYVKTTIL
jgi:RAB protein geranylgeranyltransferase component A